MALPSITGSVVRKISLQHISASSDKEYVITVTQENGTALVFTEYGPSGKLNNGRCETPSPVSFLSATAKAESLMAGKIKHAKTPYSVVSDEFFDVASASASPAPPHQSASTPPKIARPVGASSAALLNLLI